MGLVISHGCWKGSYSQFHDFRLQLARLAKFPLGLMPGFMGELVDEIRRTHPTWPDEIPEVPEPIAEWLPIRWEIMSAKKEPLVVLFDHEDNEGKIKHKHLEPLRNRMKEIFELCEKDDWFKEALATFIAGLEHPIDYGEDIYFS